MSSEHDKDSGDVFQDIYEQFLALLKISGRVLEVSSHFGPDKALNSMLNYLWGLDEFHTCFSNINHKSLKDDTEAYEYRKEGNTYYQKKQFDKALHSYNKSIIFSELPKDSEKESRPEGATSLSLGFANRSAVLLELCEYERSLLDISRAAENGYPKVLMHKLKERKAKCLIGLKKIPEAKDILEKSLENLNLKEDLMKNVKNNFERLLQSCDSQLSNMNKEDSDENKADLSSHKYKHVLCPTPKDVPSFSKANSIIPSLSCAGELSYSPEKGRFLIATRDIFPGEVVIKEESLCSVVLPSLLYTHCSSCLLRTMTPIPCLSCSSVIFCKEECRKKAMDQFHSIECTILPSLLNFDMGSSPLLAERLIVQTSLSSLKKMVQLYTNESNSKLPRDLGFDEFGVYNSSDYRTIYHLVTNKEKRSVGDLFKRCAMSLIILKAISTNSSFFNRDKLLPDENLPEDHLLVANVLFIHLMSLPCNAHSLTELSLNTKKYEESHIEEIGAGAFGVLSLTNHSCNPSLARSSYGTTVIARAVQFIPKGSELTDSYGEHYALSAIENRQNKLRKQYYFTCCCNPCSNDWPSYTSLPTKLSLRCPTCSAVIEIRNKGCDHCGMSLFQVHSEADETESSLVSLKVLYETILRSMVEYHESYSNVLKGQMQSIDYKHIIKVVTFYSRYAAIPNKGYFEAQETLKHCFDINAAHYVLPLT